MILELGILASHAIWLLRTRHVRRAAAAEGKTFDDILNEKAHAGTPWKFAERRFCFKSARKGRKSVDVEMQPGPMNCDELGRDTSTVSSSAVPSMAESELAPAADG